MIYFFDVLSPSLTFLDMVQFEQYDTNPIVTVETDANTEVNLTFYCHKIPLYNNNNIFPKMC